MPVNQSSRTALAFALLAAATLAAAPSAWAQEPGTHEDSRAVEGRMPLSEMVVVVAEGVPREQEYALGTGFRLTRPDLIVTARHVADQCEPCFVVSWGQDRKAIVESVQRIARPPDAKADIAALLVESSGPRKHFRLPARPDIELGRRVGSYGYPVVKSGLTPRLLLGHIQRVYEYEYEDEHGHYRYSARELSFPSFGGQSGSPVFSNEIGHPGARENAVAVVTTGTVVQGLDAPHASASWAVGLSLFPFAEWLSSL